MAYPKIVRNFYLFFNGVSQIGKCEMVKLPKVGVVTEEIWPAGLDGPVEVDVGCKVEPLQLTSLECDAFILSRLGGYFRDSIVEIRAATRQQNNPVPGTIVCRVRGALKEADPAELKNGTVPKFSYTVIPRFYELEIDGQTIHKIDLDKGTRIISGVDQASINKAAAGGI